MARAPLVLETHGKITRKRVNGTPTAFARYRDTDGKTRKVQRSGRTLAEAVQNLQEALKERVMSGDEHAVLTPDSTVNELVKEWENEATASGEYATATLRTYKQRAKLIITPGIGEVRLREVTVSMLDRFIKLTIKNNGPGSARTIRTVLTNAFGLAVRHGLVPFNLVENTAKVPLAKSTPKAPSIEKVQRLLAHLKAWDAEQGKQNKAVYLHDLISLYAATGTRTAELLALTWPNVEFTEDGAFVSISSTLVVNEAGKLEVQDATKTASGMRRLTLPKSAAVMLQKRRVDSFNEIVFPSSRRTYRWPHNVRRDWRAALEDTEFVGITPTSLRKAVATHLRNEMGIEVASGQLGHSDERVTKKHYAERVADAPDASLALEKFFQSAG